MDIGWACGGGDADPIEFAGDTGGDPSIMPPIPDIIGSILIDPKGCIPAAAAAAAAAASAAGDGAPLWCGDCCESNLVCVRMCRVIISRRQAA